MDLHAIQPTFIVTGPKEIELLNRYFCTKTIFNVDLGCDEEARQVLEASLADAAVRHALSSLRALREDFETSGDVPASVAKQTPRYHYGIEQYGLALGGLVSTLSFAGFRGAKSALLSCQIFISIEQVQGNYAAMAQHITRGLSIMHHYRARPGLLLVKESSLANNDQIPLLDVFIIKLFAAPCKFAEPPAAADVSDSTSVACPISRPQSTKSRDLRSIAPDLRAQLTRIAASTLQFLDKMSRVDSTGLARQLLPDKAALLDSLELWFNDLELVQRDTEPPCTEPISSSFMRLFYLVLKIVLSGALDPSPAVFAKLQTYNDQLQGLANDLQERLKAYEGYKWTSSERGKSSTVRQYLQQGCDFFPEAQA